MIGTTTLILVDVVGFDKCTTTAGGAVDAVFGCIFLIFAIPILFEFVVEQFFDLWEGYYVGGTAFWRHVLWIGDGQLEDTT